MRRTTAARVVVEEAVVVEAVVAEVVVVEAATATSEFVLPGAVGGLDPVSGPGRSSRPKTNRAAI
jgi:hypothetical protein